MMAAVPPTPDIPVVAYAVAVSVCKSGAVPTCVGAVLGIITHSVSVRVRKAVAIPVMPLTFGVIVYHVQILILKIHALMVVIQRRVGIPVVAHAVLVPVCETGTVPGAAAVLSVVAHSVSVHIREGMTVQSSSLLHRITAVGLPAVMGGIAG